MKIEHIFGKNDENTFGTRSEPKKEQNEKLEKEKEDKNTSLQNPVKYSLFFFFTLNLVIYKNII